MFFCFLTFFKKWEYNTDQKGVAMTMKLKTIDKINLYYPEEEEAEIENIINMIKTNRLLFNTSVDSTIIIDHHSPDKIKVEDNNTYIVKQFDDLFDYVVERLISNPEYLAIFNQPELMPALYIQLLSKKLLVNEEASPFLLLPNHAEDDLYTLIALKYFDNKHQFTELTTFLKTRNNQEQLFDWLQQTERFNVYNYLLELTVDMFKEDDLDFFTTMDDILYKMRTNFVKSFLSEDNQDKEISIPQLSSAQAENLLIDFLKQIHVPEEWISLYFSLKEKNYIIYEKVGEDGKNHSACYFDQEDQAYKLKITDYDHAKTFLNLVHEFAHYISLQKGQGPYSLLEYPSIYYERVAGQYLITRGYDPEVVEYLLSRQKNNYDLYCTLADLFLDINSYGRGKPIRREEKIASSKRKVEAMLEAKKELLKLSEDYQISIRDSFVLEIEPLDYDKEVDGECDDYINAFLIDGIDILNGYQYLIADYLVEKTLENKNQAIDQAMIEITTNLPNYNMNSVLETLNLTGIFAKEESDKELEEAISAYQKKLK